MYVEVLGLPVGFTHLHTQRQRQCRDRRMEVLFLGHHVHKQECLFHFLNKSLHMLVWPHFRHQNLSSRLAGTLDTNKHVVFGGVLQDGNADSVHIQRTMIFGKVFKKKVRKVSYHY